MLDTIPLQSLHALVMTVILQTPYNLHLKRVNSLYDDYILIWLDMGCILDDNKK